MNEVN